MRIVSKHNIYFDRRFHVAFPAAVVTDDGSILLTFRRGRDHRRLFGAFRDDDASAHAAEFDRVDHLDCRSHIAALRLSSDLTPLGEAVSLPCDAEAGDQDPSLLRLRSGRILQTGFYWQPISPWAVAGLRELGVGVAGSPQHHGVGFIFWGGYARWSDDQGRSWSAPRDLPVIPGMPDLVPGERPYFGGAVRGRAVETADGTVLQAAYIIRPATGRGVAVLHASCDGGESWEYRGEIAEDDAGEAAFLEPALAQSADGKLFAFHRTNGLKGRVAVSISDDQGMNWRPWRAINATGLPSDALPLPDGRILLLYGRRHPPFGVRGRIWNPDKETFTRGAEIIVCDDAPSPDVGYPWALPLPGGDIAVFYYRADSRGLRGVAATVLRP
jgi:hypothetical protein